MYVVAMCVVPLLSLFTTPPPPGHRLCVFVYYRLEEKKLNKVRNLLGHCS
jgi:hypothetical protein